MNSRRRSIRNRRTRPVVGASCKSWARPCRWQGSTPAAGVKTRSCRSRAGPKATIPGSSRYFATAMELNGNAVGLYAASYDGRPIKIEGNPRTPIAWARPLPSTRQPCSACTIPIAARASSAAPVPRAKKVPGRSSAKRWASSRARCARAAARACACSPSAALRRASAEQKRRLLAAFPQAKWVTFEPTAFDGPRAGSVLAFGKAYRSHYAFDAAKVVVTLDADVVHPTFPAGLANARALTKNRVPDAGEMNRVYAIESCVTLTGGISDHRLALKAGLIKAVAAYLDAADQRQGQSAARARRRARQARRGVPQGREGRDLPGRVAADLLANIGQQRDRRRPASTGGGARARASLERAARQRRSHGVLHRRHRRRSTERRRSRSRR